MKLKSFLVSLIAIFAVVVLVPSMSSAQSIVKSEEENKHCELDEEILNDPSTKVSVDSNGIETIKVTNPKLLEKIEPHLDKPEGATLSSFTIVNDPNLGEVNGTEPRETKGPETQPQFLLSLERTGTTTACGTNEIGYTSGKGTLELSVTDSVSTTINSSVGVSLSKINADLGTSLSNTHEVTSKTTYRPPSGRTGVIEAYPRLRGINFDVRSFGIKRGSGTVWYATGVCFAEYYL